MSVARFRYIWTSLFGGWKVHWNLHLFYWVNVLGRKRNENMAPTPPVWSTMMKGGQKVKDYFPWGLCELWGHIWSMTWVDERRSSIAPKVILESQGLASLGGHRCHGHEYSHERTSTIDRRDTFNEVDIKWKAEEECGKVCTSPTGSWSQETLGHFQIQAQEDLSLFK